MTENLLPFVKFAGNYWYSLEFAITFVLPMKKLVTSIALVCYLAVSCGVVINYHYCMNRLASTQLFASGKNFCNKCGMHTKRSGGCCHDEVRVVKLVQDQNTFSSDSYNIPSIEAAVTVPSQFIAASFYNIDERRHFQDHSPPLLSEQDTYLQINVFRIWDLIRLYALMSLTGCIILLYFSNLNL